MSDRTEKIKRWLGLHYDELIEEMLDEREWDSDVDAVQVVTLLFIANE